MGRLAFWVCRFIRSRRAVLLPALGALLFRVSPLHADNVESSLPRHLHHAEPSVIGRLEVPTRESHRKPEPVFVAALHSVGERISSLPNPYRSSDFPGPSHSWLDAPAPPLGESERERHWFQMEDSAEMMGTRLGRHVSAGLQVEFVGPAEDPRDQRRIIAIKGDPFHPRYVLTTAGLRIRF